MTASTLTPGSAASASTVPGGRRLVVVALYLNQTGHEYNELKGYRLGAEALRLPIHILVPQAADAALGKSLSAERVLGTMPQIHLVSSGEVLRDLTAFADGVSHLTSLWSALDHAALNRNDLLLFVQANVFFIAGIGHWLSQKHPHDRPRVFFRFTGGEVIDQVTGGWRDAAAFYRLAARDLNTREGRDGVFFLVHNQIVARAVTNACNRRTFLMPLPKYFPLTGRPTLAAAPSDVKTIYVHLNRRSAELLDAVNELARSMALAHPDIRFLLKTSDLSSQGLELGMVDEGLRSQVRILPDELGVDEYFANIEQADVVLLAYPSIAYASLKSGVFAEAAACGKPVVAPAETGIAHDIREGRGVGHVFHEPSAKSMRAALEKTLAELPTLTAAAQAIAERVRHDNASQRYLERMLTLADGDWDMHPRLQVGEEIEFRHPIDSSIFMRDGWGETEDWGAWTVQEWATLNLLPEAEVEQALSIRVHVSPWLAKERPELRVQVTANGEPIAMWEFLLGERYANGGLWRTATLPSQVRGDGTRPILVAFLFENLKSPQELGISSDTRRLGLGFRKLMLVAAE